MVTVPVHDLNAGLELVQSSLNKKIPVTDGGRGLNLFYLPCGGCKLRVTINQ